METGWGIAMRAGGEEPRTLVAARGKAKQLIPPLSTPGFHFGIFRGNS